ncbi:MAG: SGNH/GDSL hydrolase family protein, partial [Clostridia bacterium]|nr:SGNH/GDSL hydrolase family protein [Clostridia bacterium]
MIKPLYRFALILFVLSVVIALTSCNKTESNIVTTDQLVTSSQRDPFPEFTVRSVIAWIGYPASEIDLISEVPVDTSRIVFDYDSEKLEIDPLSMTVTVKAKGNFKVTASSPDGSYSTSFNVKGEEVNKKTSKYDTSSYNDYVKTLRSDWKVHGKPGETSVFIGDSFFDIRWFFTNFDNVTKDFDALCYGVSATTSCDWEIFAESFLQETDPKNIIMHIGTNNIYDDGMSESETVSALQRMFYVIHQICPYSNIYWFNISQRNYDVNLQKIVSKVNSRMAEWCECRSWIT